MRSITVRVDLAKYQWVDLDVEDAVRFLESLVAVLGKRTNDIAEARRYIENFDEFYEYMRKKFKDFIAPPRSPTDYIRGTVIVDKVKLYISGNGSKRVVLVLDRRVPREAVEEALKRTGFDEVRFEKMV